MADFTVSREATVARVKIKGVDVEGAVAAPVDQSKFKLVGADYEKAVAAAAKAKAEADEPAKK